MPQGDGEQASDGREPERRDGPRPFGDRDLEHPDAGVEVEFGRGCCGPGRAWKPWMLVWNVPLIGWLIGAALLVRALHWPEWAYTVLAVAGAVPLSWLVLLVLSRASGRSEAASCGLAADFPVPGERPEPRTPWWHMAAGGVGLLVWLGAFFVGSHLSQGRTLATFPWAFVSGSGPIVLAYILLIPAIAGGAVRTMTLRCLSCGEVRHVSSPSLRAPSASCSACGAAWHLPREVRRATHVTIGRAAIIVLGTLGLVGVMIGTQHFTRLVPTAALVRVLAEDPGSSVAAWSAVRDRGLTREQSDVLATALLERRSRGWSLSSSASRWLDSRIAALPLTPETIGEHLDEVFGLALRVPGVPSGADVIDLTGREVTVEIGVERYEPSLPALMPAILVEGVWVDDEWESRRHAGMLALYSVRSEWISYGRTKRHIDLSVPATTFEFEGAGEHEVHAAVWLVLPNSLAGRLQAEEAATGAADAASGAGTGAETDVAALAVRWGGDGRPIIPDATHLERRVLTIRVRVP